MLIGLGRRLPWFVVGGFLARFGGCFHLKMAFLADFAGYLIFFRFLPFVIDKFLGPF